tara:strand:+ start:106 stop:420 length:315 start_codon:yes stop_codon:yes gene_type:complete
LKAECGPAEPPAEFIRIAKNQKKVFGIYELDRSDKGVFVIRSLIVDQASRRNGIGRWLLGHAIGVAESKGGHQLLLRSQLSKAFFQKFDFYEEGTGLKYDLIRD